MNAIHTILFAIFVTTLSCNQPGMLVKNSDVDPYMEARINVEKSRENALENMLFWQNRLTLDTGSYVNMMQLGYAYMQQFGVTGEVDFLWRADSLFNRSNQITQGKEDGILFTLAQTAITTHRFSLAWDYIEAISNIDHDPLTYNLVRFDAAMELGYTADANQCLQRLQQKDGFDYLIRKAKLKDHLGDLPSAITLMEKALDKARQTKSNNQTEWALTNLADMYGHNGDIKKAYDGYKQVLDMDPANQYALRGLGWIAFSHDKNTKTAHKIFTYLNSLTAMPDHVLTLGEIARYDGDEEKAIAHFNAFAQKASSPQFGNMYHKYLIAQYTNNLNQPGIALQLATKELKNRYTPETVNWMAWASFSAGKYEQAIKLLMDPINNQNHEPDALLQTAQMLKAKGQNKRALAILEELQESHFELGPNTAKRVNELMKMEEN